MNLWEFAAQQAQESPQEPQEAPESIEAPAALKRSQKQTRSAEADARAVYQTYQENTKRSAAAQASILKGLQTGANPYQLLLAACNCIGAMTGNRDFARMAATYISEISGQGLHDPAALEIELENVKARLAMLRRPELEQTGAIQRAIIEHERLVKEITDARQQAQKTA